MEKDIQCPKCSWKATTEKLWQCSCRHVWDTFHTGGICPKCKIRWEDTCCPECHKWSPHLDWYSDLNLRLKEALKNINIKLSLVK